MKNSMKRVFFYVGMGSCLSTKTAEKPPSDVSMDKTSVINPVHPSIWEVTGSKEEQFFDSKGWLESDDEDFVSVNGDNSPLKQFNNNRDHQGRRLSELFKDSSFSSDSKTSLKAAIATTDETEHTASAATTSATTSTTTKWQKQKSGRSVKRCIPSLVRTLSCGDRKKITSPTHIAVVGG